MSGTYSIYRIQQYDWRQSIHHYHRPDNQTHHIIKPENERNEGSPYDRAMCLDSYRTKDIGFVQIVATCVNCTHLSRQLPLQQLNGSTTVGCSINPFVNSSVVKSQN
jgi:hypothetical protein